MILHIPFGIDSLQCQGDANYSSFGQQDTSFIWVVEPLRNVSGLVGSRWSEKPTYEIQTLGAPGDRTIFVVLGPPAELNYENSTVGAQYWTSPMYIVGNNPLPINPTTTSAGGKKQM